MRKRGQDCEVRSERDSGAAGHVRCGLTFGDPEKSLTESVFFSLLNLLGRANIR